MKRFLSIFGIAVVVLSTQAWLTPAPAQQERAAPAQMERAAPVKHVEGQIKSVDPSGKTLTLSNGTMLMIPDTVKVNRDELKPGAQVKAAYEEEAGGGKVATSLEVHPAKK